MSPAAPHRILIVEDEPSIAENISYALETEGFVATWCASGANARQKVQSSPFDLVVLDISLPDDNGLEFCRWLRQFSSTPVIFVTARSSEIDRVVGLELGADDYVVKPFSPRELAARVKAVLRRTGPASILPAAGPPFEIDEARLRISYFGEPLDLTRYEFRLLAILVKRPGHVFSREKLMEMAWDEPDASFDRTVDAHIKSLRGKLRLRRPQIDPIVTHRGTGYALKDDW
jgi:two-component system catabolic regulation response regulator CreB